MLDLFDVFSSHKNHNPVGCRAYLIEAYARVRQESFAVDEALSRLKQSPLSEMWPQQGTQPEPLIRHGWEEQRETASDKYAESLRRIVQEEVNARADQDMAAIAPHLINSGVYISQAEMFKKYEGEWPDIRNCFKHAERNDMRDQCKAKDPDTGEYLKDQWYEGKCLRWAGNQGKLQENRVGPEGALRKIRRV